MSAPSWKLIKERQEVSGLLVRLYRCCDPANRFRRVTQKSRAGGKPGRFGLVWCVVEYAEKHGDGTLSPWQSEFSWPKPSEAEEEK